MALASLSWGAPMAEIVVSSQMASAGLGVFENLNGTYPAHLLVVEIYKAMALEARQDHAQSKQKIPLAASPNACSDD